MREEGDEGERRMEKGERDEENVMPVKMPLSATLALWDLNDQQLTDYKTPRVHDIELYRGPVSVLV